MSSHFSSPSIIFSDNEDKNVFKEAMDEVKKEADGLDFLTNNIMELGTQVCEGQNTLNLTTF